MGTFIEDLVGRRFGRLTVISHVRNKRNRLAVVCQCDCGKTVTTCLHGVRSGKAKSCGCLRRDSARICVRKAIAANQKHGRCFTSEYTTWASMKQRCLNPKAMGYKDYGGRGITIHPAWIESFEAFFKDMGPRPSNEHSLDRIDVNGPYIPTNCRWATRKVQQNNQRPRLDLTADQTRDLYKFFAAVGYLLGLTATVGGPYAPATAYGGLAVIRLQQ